MNVLGLMKPTPTLFSEGFVVISIPISSDLTVPVSPALSLFKKCTHTRANNLVFSFLLLLKQREKTSRAQNQRL